MKMETNSSSIVDLKAFKKDRNAHSQPTALDTSAYENELSDCNWSSEQKEEFLRALWSVIVAFVDLGYGIHPTQRVLPPNAPHVELMECVADFHQKAA